jgi:hypothetical protein
MAPQEVVASSQGERTPATAFRCGAVYWRDGQGRRGKPGTVESSDRLGFFKPEDDAFPLDFGILEID